jgi:hypothetical protein
VRCWLLMMRLGACLLGVVLCGAIAIAQLKRDSWKLAPFAVDLTHSLADAPLSNSEREQIYRALDNKGMHESFTDQQRELERETVMRSRVGSIALARNGSEQVFVQGPPSMCGARTECIRIFVRQDGQLRLVFDSWGTGFSVQASYHNGYHDIGTGTIWSAGETEYRDYRWGGARYQQVDCYRVIDPQADGTPRGGNTSGRPAIAECR